MNKFFFVLGHTFFSRLKSKSFIFSTIFVLLLITLFANIETIVNYFISDDEEKIAVIDETEAILPLLEQFIGETDEGFTFVLYTEGEEQGKEAVQNGEYDGLLLLSYDEDEYPQATYFENSATETWNQM